MGKWNLKLNSHFPKVQISVFRKPKFIHLAYFTILSIPLTPRRSPWHAFLWYPPKTPCSLSSSKGFVWSHKCKNRNFGIAAPAPGTGHRSGCHSYPIPAESPAFCSSLRSWSFSGLLLDFLVVLDTVVWCWNPWASDAWNRTIKVK